MANHCYDTSLLQHSGTSQLQRVLQALMPDYAKVDERTTAHLILFAKKYGAYLKLNHFDGSDDPENSWQALMSGDVSVIIAGLADWKVKTFASYLADVKDKIQTAVTDGDAKQHFKTIFDFIFSLASALDISVKQLPDNIRFTPVLSVAISSGLAQPLALLYQYYKAFRDAPLSLIDESSQDTDPVLPVSPVVLSGNFNPDALGKAWQTVRSNAITITLGGVSVKDDISHILTHNLFTGPLQLFINGIFNLVNKAPGYLEETLTNYPSHQPHYALYLTFLQLFRYAQDHLNGFTQNHLDFYYKDVLRLKNRNAEPGFVHLVFELQKNADQYLLSKGTAFKAGKDENNNDLLYAIANDVVLQKASVQSLQSLYIDKNAGVLYASSVANSEDGEGAALLSADQSWSAFRNEEKTAGAGIGFAIASNLLFLNEGERTIRLIFHCTEVVPLSEDELGSVFTIHFTGKKDWLKAGDCKATKSGNDFTLAVTVSGDASPIVPYSEKIHSSRISTTLPAAKLMLADYRYYKAINQIRIGSLTIEVEATVKDLSLQNREGVINAAKPFKPFGEFPDKGASFIIGSEEIFQKQLTGFTIDIDWQDTDDRLVQKASKQQIKKNIYKLKKNQYIEAAAMNQVTSFVTSAAASGDDAPAAKMVTMQSAKADVALDTTMSPKAIAKMEIKGIKASGQKLFTKADVTKASVIKLIAEARLITLSGSHWNEDKPLATLIDARQDSISLDETKSAGIPVAAIDFTGNKPYDIKAVSGFVKLRLDTDNYSLPTYLYNLQTSLTETEVATDIKGGVLKGYIIPKPQLAAPAPHLVANSIRIHYSARITIDFGNTLLPAAENAASALFHIEPFGTRRMMAHSDQENIPLLPQFEAGNNPAGNDGGELWIGIRDAFASETLSILFQVSDGSSNPMKDMTVLSWFYLSHNQWLPLDKAALADDTVNLTRSGIITLTLPNNITSGNTRADASLLWIKVIADHDTDAVNKLVAIRTNAAKATFVQDLTKGIEYKKPLDANIISKPSVPLALIKKTEQPYPSFGGRLRESDDKFYIRVSERLRHKRRAVTTWDYERLVLDYFPQVHKAKCISHTGFITSPNSDKTKYSEVLPGHLMLITVPDIRNNSSANALRPYTSKGLIEQVKKYLGELASPFVTLHVSNPQFEDVQFDFDVMFLPGYDATLYKKQLNDDIERFLTPWAYDSGRDIEFGGKIEKSVVLNFVEERPYVDFVTNFTMNQFVPREDGSLKALMNIEEAIASTARSILVSYSDKATGIRHIIQSLENSSNHG